MAKFKVGDRVRALQDSGLGAFLAGKEYEVLDVRYENITAINERGQRDSWGEHHFELLPVAEATSSEKPAFKVGDRVRAIDNHGGLIIGETYSISSYAEPTRIGRWLNLEGRRSNYSNDGSFLESSFEPALKIEAGKYYRTRDGRKVGPLMARNNDSYAFAADIAGDIGIRIFQKDGVHGSRWIGNEPNLDLIAEWVDEPVKATAPVQFTMRNFKLTFEPVAKPAIVALIENGQPKPSVAPFVHANETLAAKEAARLASLQKGKEFGVYVMTQKVSEPAPSYKHEWQRFAAKGEKISAIKELRSVTGLGLKAAKDAVEHWIAHDEPYSRIAA